MSHAKYNRATARVIAKRIFDNYKNELFYASAEGGVPDEWLAGLTGMENPQCNEWPKSNSRRFEPGVYKRFVSVRSWKNPLTWSYNGIKYSMIKNMSDAALRNLATSYGQTQIMGYYILNVFNDVSIADLRDPKKHYFYACQFLKFDARMLSYLGKGNFRQVAHIWNSGRAYTGGKPKTHSPYYMDNCTLVLEEYAKISKEYIPVAIRPDKEGQSAEGLVKIDTEEIDNMFDVKTEGLEDDPIYNDGGMGQSITTDVPEIKPGYKTSQGIMTYVFLALSVVLSALGFAYSPEQVSGVYDQIMKLVEIIGPMLAMIPVLITYINSRGKIYSNSINATAQMNIAQSGLGDIFGSIFGGRDWKDPERYIDMVKKAGKLGVPGIDKIDDYLPGNKIEGQTGQFSYDGLDEKIEKVLGSVKTVNENVLVINKKATENARGLTQLANQVNSLKERMDREESTISIKSESTPSENDIKSIE